MQCRTLIEFLVAVPFFGDRYYWNASSSEKNDSDEALSVLLRTLSPAASDTFPSDGTDDDDDSESFRVWNKLASAALVDNPGADLSPNMACIAFFVLSRFVSACTKCRTNFNRAEWSGHSKIFCMVNVDSSTKGCNSTAIRFCKSITSFCNSADKS